MSEPIKLIPDGEPAVPEYTPGPWVMDNVFTEDPTETAIRSTTRVKRICTVPSYNGKADIANAALIAAAPDLLKALQDILPDYEAMLKIIFKTDPESYSEVLAARTAINKALNK